MLEIQQATIHIPNLLYLGVWSVFTALLSLFLDFTFREKNIFDGWLNFWADWWLSKNKPEVLDYAKGKTDDDIKIMQEGKYDTVREYKHDHVEWFWWKPLGGCVVCMNPWISFLLSPALIASLTLPKIDCFICFNLLVVIGYIIFIILFYILFSNFLVRFFHEKLL